MEKQLSKSNVADIFELNMAQKGMLFHYLDDSHKNLYIIQVCLQLTGTFDIALLEESIKSVQVENEILRSVFEWEKTSKPIQIVLKEVPVNFYYQDISSDNGPWQITRVEEFIRKDREENFDLRKVPFRVNILKLQDQSFLLVITHHHILYDGWSTGILLKELFSTYHALSLSKWNKKITKPDYKTILLATKKKDISEASMLFWKEYLLGYQKNTFIIQRQRHEKSRPQQNIGELLIKTSVTDLDKFVSSHKVTRASVIYTAYGLLMQKYTNQDDVIFGTPISNRDAALVGIDRVMGNFINTLPLRVSCTADQTLLEVVKKVGNELIVRNQYSHTSYNEIKEILKLKPKYELFDSILVIENYPLDLKAINVNTEFTISLKSTYGDTGLPIVIHAFFKEVLEIEIMYQTNLLSEDFILTFAEHFKSMLQAILKAPENTVGSLEYLTPLEKKELLFKHNNTKWETVNKITVLDLFRAQVKKNPSAIAVIFEDTELTYEELDEKSDALAHCLIEEYGIQQHDHVGICLDRNTWLVISILGILKSGAAYIPIDPEYPSERKRNISTKANIALLLTEMYYAFDVDYYNGPVLAIDVEFNSDNYFTSAPHTKVSAQDLAYVIFTSGSTGNPKGVMVEHGSLTNYICWAQDYYVGKDSGNFPLYTSTAFDLTVTSIFVPLVSGNSIIVSKSQDKGEIVGDLLLDDRVDIIKLTPSHLKVLLENSNSLQLQSIKMKKLIVGGEQLPTALAQKVHERFAGKVTLYNEYGPTETTVGCMIYQFSGQDHTFSVPIGHPIRNIQIYLLDRYLHPVPNGVAGELYIAGLGVARGYLKSPDQTKERFLDNPFFPGTRMYKTGDVAIRLSSGEIEFLGREDNQIKLRGYRIEPGDIENQLLSHESIQQVAVHLMGKNEDPYLACFYVANNTIEPEMLKSFLQKKLPDYMIPSRYVYLKKMPLTLNGKLDTTKLPDPKSFMFATEQFTPPSTENEKRIAALWKEILNIKEVGVNTDFFLVGGHSLTATRLASRLKDSSGVNISVSTIFEQTTIRLQAKYIEEQQPAILPKVKRLESDQKFRPLSSGQERLWFIDQYEGTLQYHMPLILDFQGNLDTILFEQSVREIVNRHVPLRTVFKTKQGIPYQYALPKDSWKMENSESIKGLSDKRVREIIHQTVQKRFDLEKDHMLRIKLLEGESDLKKIIIVGHHIAFDGWSVPIFLGELETIYRSLVTASSIVLPELPLEFLDFSSWQHEHLSGNFLEEGLLFWENHLKDVEPIDLPLDFNRPKHISERGANHSFTVDKDTTAALSKIAVKEGASMFMMLLAALKVLFFRYSGQKNICIGTPIANREQTEIEGLIGFFANTIALKSEVHAELSFREFLQQIKESTLLAYANQQIPFEKVIERVVDQRDLSRSPLFQVMLIFQTEKDPFELLLDEGTAFRADWNANTAKFELSFEAVLNSDEIELTLNYSTDLFKEATIKRLGLHLYSLLHSVAANPSDQLDRLLLMTKADTKDLFKFNNTQVQYPENTTVIDLFKEQVELNPNNIAVVFEGTTLSYGALDKKSNRLANFLLGKTINGNKLVPICMDRSLEMVVSILGILKAGMAYVPIDPNYPQNRIDYILKDTGAPLVLTVSKYKGLFSIPLLAVDHHLANVDPETTLLPQEIRGTTLAYVIYTSGTSGNPKGVLCTHAGLYNRLLWMRDYLEISETDIFLQKTTFCFDVSVWEFLLPLITGTKMVLAKPEGHKDPNYLQKLIDTEKVSIMHFVPSMLAAFLIDVKQDSCKSLRNVVCSGEALKSSTVDDFQRKLPLVKLHNLYGPTEASIDVTAIPLQRRDREIVTIGRPVSNTQIYIVDQHNKLQPIGAIGELLIGGVQVADGYLNRSDLTAQKFITNPVNDMGTSKVYRTGDLARWLPDGTIEYIGRIDDQVKLRGYRVELHEIEVVMEKCKGVALAVLRLFTDTNGNSSLHAYVHPDKEYNKASVLAELKTTLPEYMIPSSITELQKFPLTPNGKIDRKGLPEPNVSTTQDRKFEEPESTIEKKLASIWQELLNRERIGIHDNFFELGGHSLIAIQALSQINEVFSANISIPVFFELATIDKIQKYLEVIASVNKREHSPGVTTIEL